MKIVPKVKDGFILIPVSAALKIAEFLREFEGLLGYLQCRKKDKDKAQWLAYCFEIAHGRHKEKSIESTDSWLSGLAYSVGMLIYNYGQNSIALDLLNQSGHSYQDLLDAGCATYDLKPIARALKVKLDGTPLKVRQ